MAVEGHQRLAFGILAGFGGLRPPECSGVLDLAATIGCRLVLWSFFRALLEGTFMGMGGSLSPLATGSGVTSVGLHAGAGRPLVGTALRDTRMAAAVGQSRGTGGSGRIGFQAGSGRGFASTLRLTAHVRAGDHGYLLMRSIGDVVDLTL